MKQMIVLAIPQRYFGFQIVDYEENLIVFIKPMI